MRLGKVAKNRIWHIAKIDLNNEKKKTAFYDVAMETSYG